MPFPSLLLVHGAANGAWVWDTWRRHLQPFGWVVNVLDLRGHGRSLPVDFSLVTMEDYVADLTSVAGQIAAGTGAHPVVGGWSMGGLITMMYAASHPETPALLLFAPSPPFEVAGRADAEVVRRTPSAPFGPELYGLHPDDLEASREALQDLTGEEARAVLANVRGARESGLARRQRQRGIKVPSEAVNAPSLVIAGTEDHQMPIEQNRRIASHLQGEIIEVPEAGHWGIVYSEKAVADTAWRVDAWLRRVLA